MKELEPQINKNDANKQYDNFEKEKLYRLPNETRHCSLYIEWAVDKLEKCKS